MDDRPRARAFRQIETIEVSGVGRVDAIDRPPHFLLLGPNYEEFLPGTDWLLDLAARDCSPHTIRAYAMSLLRYLRFLWAVDCPWQRATEVEVRDFVLWARQAPKFVGNKRTSRSRGRVNGVTGKRYQETRYSPKTINHTLTAVHEFYAFQMDRGLGPIVNPVPVQRHRPHAGQNPEDDFRPVRRARLRQREPERVPRSIPDKQFNQMFQRLGSNRDRALVAFYVSSGARASELLGLTGDMINYGDQLIGVIRKGGGLTWLPASPDAFVWLRLYQLERGTPAGQEPVWLTLREPRRPLRYHALRAVLNRINDLLGSNWTAHDLRHTFAVRALEGGMPLHEVQELLGHASLATTSVYTRPRINDVIAHHQAALTRRSPTGDITTTSDYDADELANLFDGRR